MISLSHVPYPKTIRNLRMGVCIATLLFALWNQLYMRGSLFLSPFILLLSPTPNWAICWQAITAPLTIPYSGIGLEMVFDLFLLNFFLVPIASFVFTFLEQKIFIRFLTSLIAVGVAVFWSANTLFTFASSCSLFSSLALSLIVFWFLLHKAGSSTIIVAIPISRWWVLFIACLIIFPAPICSNEWGKVLMTCSMALFSYLWGVAHCRLRSHVTFLTPLEHRLDKSYHALIRMFEWYIARPFRLLFRKN